MIKKTAILCSIFLNLCIVRWEPVAIRMTWEAVGSQTFTFYTENSNVFAFFVCLQHIGFAVLYGNIGAYQVIFGNGSLFELMLDIQVIFHCVVIAFLKYAV